MNKTRLKEARELVNQIIQGVDDSGNPIVGEDSFLIEPDNLRKFSLIAEALTKQLEYQERQDTSNREPFIINHEQLAKVELPEYPMGINELAKHINRVIDRTAIKGVTGAQINEKLRAAGILSHKVDEEGKKCTVINDISHQYGIKSEQGEYNGRKYEKVIFTDKGKQFLLEHFLEIMQLDEVSATR